MWSLLAQASAGFDYTNLGAAGLMGGMWLWERANSRKRDQQLDDAHERIMSKDNTINELVEVVKGNTEAMTKSADAMSRLVDRLDRQDRSNN